MKAPHWYCPFVDRKCRTDCLSFKADEIGNAYCTVWADIRNTANRTSDLRDILRRIENRLEVSARTIMAPRPPEVI